MDILNSLFSMNAATKVALAAGITLAMIAIEVVRVIMVERFRAWRMSEKQIG